MREWTSEQREAITASGNLLVAAAAGGGKTSVLVERVMERIRDQENPVDIDRLLVVTFTRAAAGQMREQIARQLAAELEKEPDSRHLQRQLLLLGRASIDTMHALCLEVLRQHFHRLELDPGFRVMDETEAWLLQQQMVEEVLEAAYREADNQPFLALVDSYGGARNDAGLKDMILNLYGFARSNPQPRLWLQEAVEMYNPARVRTLDDFPWCPVLKDTLRLELTEALSELERALDLCLQPGGPDVYRARLDSEIQQIRNCLSTCTGNWSDLYQAVTAVQFDRLPAVKGDSPLKDEVQQLRNGAKKRFTGLRDQYFGLPPAAHVQLLTAIYPLMRALSRLVNDFDQAYSRAKRERALLDFSDLEHLCLQVLTDGEAGTARPSAAACELRERFHEVLVDEYQDINAVQEEILQRVSRQDAAEPNLFLVGDVKQSIYRFRLADPGLFLKKYRDFSLEPGSRDRLITLQANFRCRRGVVEGVNYLFSRIMTPTVGEMAYDESARLVLGRNIAAEAEAAGREAGLRLLSDEIEIIIVDKNGTSEGATEGGGEEPAGAAEGESPAPGESGDPDAERETEAEILDTTRVEARLIAGRIRELMAGGYSIWDDKQEGYRPLSYRDIAVLMRATRTPAGVFVEELKAVGIPAYCELRTGYFDTTEITVMLSLLSLIDNPQQDIPLLAVLRSPLVGLNAEELARIRLYAREGNFYQALSRVLSASDDKVGMATILDWSDDPSIYTGHEGMATATRPWPPELEEDTLTKLRRFIEKLENWRTLARQEPVSVLLWQIFRDSGYYDYVGGMPGGEQRQANLRLLQTWAREYENSNMRGLFHFLRFVDRMRDEGQDRGLARTLNENDDVVRITSIHQSKGLEYPVVLVAGMGRKFNLLDLNGPLLTHKELGMGPQIIDGERALSYPSLAKLALREKKKLEFLAEEMRLLYVAMTRARDKLIMVGTPQDLGKSRALWERTAAGPGPTLPDYALARAACYLDWVGPALMQHPAGACLWENGSPDGIAREESAPFTVTVLTAEEAGTRGESGGETEQDLLTAVRRRQPLPAGGAWAAEVDRRLSWQYPYTPTPGKRAKVSVSQARGAFDRLRQAEELGIDPGALGVRESEAGPQRIPFREQPRFLQEAQGLTAAERGTATHLVMQHLDLTGVLNRQSIADQIGGMVERGLITPAQAEVVEVGSIAKFWASDLGRRLLAAHRIWREVPFSLVVPASLFYPDLASLPEETVLVQGIMDCLADEGDGYLLIDYKTNRPGPGGIEELTREYRSQMELYARAVQEILGAPVKDKFLYFLAVGTACRVS